MTKSIPKPGIVERFESKLDATRLMLRSIATIWTKHHERTLVAQSDPEKPGLRFEFGWHAQDGTHDVTLSFPEGWTNAADAEVRTPQ